jgi:hypothetical protein
LERPGFICLLLEKPLVMSGVRSERGHRYADRSEIAATVTWSSIAILTGAASSTPGAAGGAPVANRKKTRR